MRLTMVILLLGLVVAADVSATEFDVEVRTGVGRSDNLGRVADGEQSGTFLTAGFDFFVVEETRKFDIDIGAEFDYVKYEGADFESELIGGLDGSAVISVIEERLRWLVQDNYGQQLFDPLQPARPGNRENINFFTTGPTISLFSGGRSVLEIGATYSSVQYEESPFDNDRLGASVRLGRDVNRSSNLSFNVTTESVEYDNGGLSPDYDRNAAFLRYETDGANNTVSIDFGYNEVDRDGAKSDGILVDLIWTRQVSANSSLSLSGGTGFSDQGSIFRYYQDVAPGPGDTEDVVLTGQPFQNDYAALSYSLGQERYSLGVLARWSREGYEGDTIADRNILLWDLRLQREISRSVFAGFNLRFYRREFTLLDTRDDDLSIGFFGGYRFTPGLSISLDVQFFARDSATEGGDYEEGRVFCRISYVPVWSR